MQIIPNTISVLRNTSSGVGVFSFATKIDFTVGTAPYGISLADMDGDGKVDVIVPNSNAVGSVTILRNTSTSGNVNFAGSVSFATDTFPFYLSVGDLNKDGKADIAAANGGGSLVSILQNTSSGIGNINFAARVDLPTIATANTVAINDMDGDGNLDMVIASNNNILSFFHNTSPVGGTISFGNRVDFANSNNARAIAIADFDGDGKNDVLTGNNASSNISVFRNDPLLTPTVQASNVIFTGTTGTATTASWTNGNGSSRAVFMYAGSSGSPVPVDLTTYTANAAFGAGTQIGTTGWYCLYNGTGTTVNITGLTSGLTYQLMTVEYNGSTAGNEVYFSTVGTGNPAGVTTLSDVATLSNLSLSQGTLTPVFATATTAYTATVPNAVTSLTLTPTTTDSNATVKVNGTVVTSGNASGVVDLLVGPNVITTVVTAQDGTTIGTYTVTVTRTEPTIVTTGTLSALTTIYGTPSASATFNVSGTDMATGILVTPPTGFEVSTDDITFTNTITVGAAGVIASAPVYVRLKGTAPVGSYSGNVVLTSTNATTVNVPTISSTVNKATLTITADNQSKVYGSANPTLTVSYTGFVNGDTEASLTTPPTISTTADGTSPVGNYPISASGAVDANYTISYVAGTLTVTPVSLTITADAQSKIYGSANPTLTVSYTGFVNGDTEASLTTPPTISTTADTASAVGTYPISVSGAISSNYTFTYIDGTLTVTPAVLTITADDKIKFMEMPIQH
ncbi:VCBS repeat-containing protein [Flavobacterium psychroterrae]|uniref:VCBS repeat-containing protein n=1 Tax=Flavobacterium psychroterrae TaxID=2133767 RepID=A0ABS5P5H2_9FLAO|nr:MBG domain-containing protein [Flavobacterium psychroterrae]MBS7229519.1 VCBS repeat-containing protein [Flavobacterium psychroterrae]